MSKPLYVFTRESEDHTIPNYHDGNYREGEFDKVVQYGYKPVVLQSVTTESGKTYIRDEVTGKWNFKRSEKFTRIGPFKQNVFCGGQDDYAYDADNHYLNILAENVDVSHPDQIDVESNADDMSDDGYAYPSAKICRKCLNNLQKN